MARLYPGMAFTNIKNNRKTYVPYMISCVITIFIYYIICSLGSNSSIAELWGGNIIQSYMNMGQAIVSIFNLIFLFYINSFLLKRRKSEFGLYNILGMEKKHIARVVFFETLFTFVGAIIVGILLGILLDKLMYLFILKLFKASVPLGFYISGTAIVKCLAFFGFIFLLIFFNSMRQIYKSKPIELLKSDSKGEKEPKSKWIMAILGLICLATGYFIAVTTDNPVAAISLFFAAIILVIIGTYLLFTSGSIVLLKLLKKNKKYYYNTKHFVSVSSMMYRMKRNAVGLANICILSTMALVMISATLSMHIGIDDNFEKRYPSEFSITAMANDPLYDNIIENLENSLKNEGLVLENRILYENMGFSAVYDEKQKKFLTDPNAYSGLSTFGMYNKLSTLVFVPLDDYNANMHENENLNENEILVYSNKSQLKTNTLNIFEKSFHVKKTLDHFIKNGNATVNIMPSHFIVVKNSAVLESLLADQQKAYGENSSFLMKDYMVNISGDSDKNKDAILYVYNQINEKISSGASGNEFSGYIKCRSAEEDTFGLDFVGLLFIGVFLGILFIMATVLIIYYKQITEGYEDKERFEIMQNVGMSHKEVKKSINSQILTVFFLPLITAGVHVTFAFPFIYKIMTLLGLFNMKLYAMCNLGCFLVFALFYTIVYVLTSKLYYGIVKN